MTALAKPMNKTRLIYPRRSYTLYNQDMKVKFALKNAYNYRSFVTKVGIAGGIFAIAAFMFGSFMPQVLENNAKDVLGYANWIAVSSILVMIFGLLFIFFLLSNYLTWLKPFLRTTGTIVEMKIKSIQHISMLNIFSKIAEVQIHRRKTYVDIREVIIHATDQEGKDRELRGFCSDKGEAKHIRVGDVWPCYIVEGVPDLAVIMKKPASPEEDRPSN